MTLWTIQPAYLYEQIMMDGFYRFDESKISKNAWFYCCQVAYDWLAGEMKKKIGDPPTGVKYPVWAWYKHYSEHKKPDLRRAEYGRKSEKMVSMEIDIPDEQVVLSDEELWHFVLNNSYLSRAENETDYNNDMQQFEVLPESEKQAETVRSWQTIFDIEPVDTEWFKKGRSVQATFWELKAEQIRKVQFFKAR